MEHLSQRVNGRLIRHIAAECGFDIAGVTAARPIPDFERFHDWVERGLAGEMRYLTDHRANVRSDLNQLLAGVRSVISVGLLYNGPEPYSRDFNDPERAWISRYAWGADYHPLIRKKLEEMAGKLLQTEPFQWRACVDTAPLLERSFARQAGLGWIGKNTCLINQQRGSWFFLGELLTTLELDPDFPAPDRCGTCTRCIDTCPTQAIVPSPQGRYELDARHCISYFTIELRAAIPEPQRTAMGHHVFGCDICQDVCPWNRKAPAHAARARPDLFAPPLERLAGLSETEFKQMFRDTPVNRAKYNGFLRNVAVAMGNAGQEAFRAPLERLAASPDPLVREHANWALAKL
ncbi:MAG: tRNA epoxyqueuosine(34) reductase QueG [Acidobacteriota bacterium]